MSLFPETFDLAGLDRWIQRLRSGNFTPELADGVYTLSDTWHISHLSGFRFHTSGRQGYWPNLFDSRSELTGGVLFQYTGPPNRPAIVIDECMGLDWGAFSLICDQPMRAGAIQFVNGGYGNSGHRFDRATIVGNGGTAFMFGSPGMGMMNCSDMRFDSCSIAGFDHAWRTCGDQQLNYTIIDPVINNCGSMLYAPRGGSFRVFGGTTTRLDWIISQGNGGRSKVNTGWVNTIPGSIDDVATIMLQVVSEVGIVGSPDNPPLIQLGDRRRVRVTRLGCTAANVEQR